MIRLVWPWLLLLLPLPWLAWYLLPAARVLTAGALRVPFVDRLAAWSGRRAGGRGRPGLRAAHAVWALLVLAAAQPQWVDDPSARPTSGRDLMLVIDISGSMRAMDFTVDGTDLDRLAMVKRVAGRFIDGRGGDRLGLVLFGATSHLRAPLTRDHETVRELLDEAEIALAGEYTALGDAIGLALKRLQDRPADSRVIVALTDGASNTGAVGPKQAARLAAEEGVRVYTIGIGREDVAAPNPYGVWSAGGAADFNREVLEAVAKRTGGVYFHALDAEGLRQAYERLDEMEPALGDAAWDYIAAPLYPVCLAAALLLGLVLAWREARR